VLAAGHPLRAEACLVCGEPAGGELVIITALIVAMQAGCHCGQIPTITQPVHARHGMPGPEEHVALCEQLAGREHPEGGPQCQA